MSAIRLKVTTITAEMSSQPWTTLASRLVRASTSSRPIPFQEKTRSVITAPDSSRPKSIATSVTMGIMALRSMCRVITLAGGSPLALAVRT
jgi:hypothetical protein